MARYTALIALGLLMVSFIIFLVGYVTPLWLWSQEGGNVRLGLWQVCTTSCYRIPLNYGFYKAAQGMETLGLLATFGAIPSFIMYVYYCRKEDKRAKKNLSWLLGFLFSLLATIFIIIGVISLGARHHEVEFKGINAKGPYKVTGFHISWSFGLTTCAGVLFLCSGLLLTADRFFH